MTVDPRTAEPWVSDEVWASLDPLAGNVSRRSGRLIMSASAVMFVGVIAVGVLWHLGFWTPQIAVSDGSEISTIRGSHQFVATFNLTNDWVRSERIDSLTTSNGLRVIAVRGLPSRLAAHASTPMITVRFGVTDCRAIHPRASSVSVRIDRLWGHTSIPIDVPLADSIHTACQPPLRQAKPLAG